MTAKEAIQLRCKDCQETTINKSCKFEDCQLYELNQGKSGCNRTKAITDYCTWCLNGLSISTCSSPNCSIYQYRFPDKGEI